MWSLSVKTFFLDPTLQTISGFLDQHEEVTEVESDIHHPTDNTLLWDTVRVLTRLGSVYQ
jgi:hypothetical protein